MIIKKEKKAPSDGAKTLILMLTISLSLHMYVDNLYKKNNDAILSAHISNDAHIVEVTKQQRVIIDQQQKIIEQQSDITEKQMMIYEKLSELREILLQYYDFLFPGQLVQD